MSSYNLKYVFDSEGNKIYPTIKDGKVGLVKIISTKISSEPEKVKGSPFPIEAMKDRMHELLTETGKLSLKDFAQVVNPFGEDIESRNFIPKQYLMGIDSYKEEVTEKGELSKLLEAYRSVKPVLGERTGKVICCGTGGENSGKSNWSPLMAGANPVYNPISIPWSNLTVEELRNLGTEKKKI